MPKSTQILTSDPCQLDDDAYTTEKGDIASRRVSGVPQQAGIEAEPLNKQSAVLQIKSGKPMLQHKLASQQHYKMMTLPTSRMLRHSYVMMKYIPFCYVYIADFFMYNT